MFLRALAAFLALPGTVAFLVPLWLVREPSAEPFHAVALLPLAVGVFLLLWCVRDFYVSGKGTLAPWAPPRMLVSGGLYRWSRNPMYLAVGTILFAWAIGFHSRDLLLYACVVMVAFHMRVVFGEEPWLSRTHGDEWRRYQSQVPRWLF